MTAEALLDELENLLNLELTDAEVAQLPALMSQWDARAGRPVDAGRLRQAVLTALGYKIVGNLQLFQGESKRGIVIRNLETRQEATVVDLSQVIA